MTNEQRKQLIDNAPKGATHCDQGEYMRCVGVCKWEYYSNYDDSWGDTEPESDTRNLDDLRAIVERDERIAELERERDEVWAEYARLLQVAEDCAVTSSKDEAMRIHDEYLSSVDMTFTLNQHNIEQQAIGVEQIGQMLSSIGFDGVEHLCERAVEQLRKQAGEL